MSSDPRPSLNLMKGSARRTSTQLGPQSREKGNGNPKNFPRLGCQGKRAFLLTPQQRPWGQLWSRVLTLSAQLLLDFHGRHLLLSVLSSNATSAEGGHCPDHPPKAPLPAPALLFSHQDLLVFAYSLIYLCCLLWQSFVRPIHNPLPDTAAIRYIFVEWLKLKARALLLASTTKAFGDL